LVALSLEDLQVRLDRRPTVIRGFRVQVEVEDHGAIETANPTPPLKEVAHVVVLDAEVMRDLVDDRARHLVFELAAVPTGDLVRALVDDDRVGIVLARRAAMRTIPTRSSS